ncbi:MAG: DUF1573 domain-containing protein, partial [Planctomycetota bacterium]|nr:DUF1573 domain-containing protein [Planctomycetota bacterium]
MNRTLLTCLLGLVAWASTAKAQLPAGQPPVVVQPAPDPQWAEKLFPKLEHDFGTIAKGSEAKLRLKITNIWQQTVHIRAAGTTCKCFQVRIPKDTLASLESTEIEVTVDTQKFQGERKSTMMITFDRPAYAEVPIPLMAYIRNDVGLTPGGAMFGNVPKGQEMQKKIQVSHVGRPDWKITELICKSPHIEAKATEIGRFNNGTTNYELVVIVKPSCPAGEFREQVTIVTDDAA